DHRRQWQASSEVLLPQLGIRPAAERRRGLRPGAAQAGGASAQDRGWHAHRRGPIHRQGRAVATGLTPRAVAASAGSGGSTWRWRKPMRMKRLVWSGLALAAGLMPAMASAGEIANYSPVDQQRLSNPEPGNWMLYRRTYDGQGFSPLDKINTSNVKNLVPVWTFSTGVTEGHEAPPIVNNGIMFIATPQAQVIALDAKTGEEIWRYKRQLPEDLFQLHPTSRGVGLWQDKVFLASTDDHLVALDAKTGKVVWDQKVQDFRKGQYLTLMPLVVNGKVIVGGSGGEFGIRGYVVA